MAVRAGRGDQRRPQVVGDRVERGAPLLALFEPAFEVIRGGRGPDEVGFPDLVLLTARG
jgi:hypothetical protein